MALKFMDPKEEYKKDKGLREEDVAALKQWTERQPHLPPLSELHHILFLQSCYFSVEQAKATVDNFYTVRTHCPEFFKNRDPCSSANKENMSIALYTALPQLTHENQRVIFCKILDPDSGKYAFAEQLKLFDMACMLSLMQDGTAEGVHIITDMENVTFGHMARLSIMAMKKFLYYLQEALPVRLKGLHFINVVSFMDKILALMKPFMKKELMDVLHLHTDSIDSLYQWVPKECLPKDLGGNADSIKDMHDMSIKKFVECAEYFRQEEKEMVVDESQRPGKPKNAGEIFGVEGTFKKLDID